MTLKKQKIRLTDLAAKTREVELEDGFITLKALSLEQIIKLLTSYRSVLMELYVKAETQGSVDLVPMLEKTPQLLADVIALSAGEEPEAVRTIGFGDQLELAAAVWEVTVPDPKKLNQLLSLVAGLASQQKSPQPSKSLNTPSLSTSDISSQEATPSQMS